MTTTELITKIENATSLDDGMIDLKDSLKNCGYWDSMSYIIFMSLVDQELGLKLSGGEVEKCQTFGDLIGLCKEKLDD